MLHGEIKVNGHVIGEWKAVRQTRKAAEYNDYECRLTYRNGAGYPMEAVWLLHQHKFGDGALALAARIIQEGMPRLHVRPMRDDEAAVDVMSRRLR